ncbi:MAG: sulfatase [Acidobacteriota bacterium]
MNRWPLLLGSILGLLVLSACGRVGVEVVSVEPGRVDFVADDLLFDVRTGPGPGGRSFEGCRLTSGWARTGAGGKWAVGPSAEVELLAAPGARRLWIDCRPSHELDGPQVVTVVADGEVAGEFRPEPGGFKWYQVELAESKAAGFRHIEFRFSRVRPVQRIAGKKDTRPLAVMVRRLALTRGPKKPKKRDWSPPVVRTPEGLLVRQAGRLYLNFRSERSVERVEIKLRPGVEGAAPVPLTLVHPRSDTLLAQKVFNRRSAVHGGVDLDAGGLDGAFQMIVDVGDGGLEIDRLEARVRRRASRAPAEGSTETAGAASRPDIVVIVLDATRADHSGSTYDYSRDTMPIVDRFADEAMVFNRVFAQAPYTTCSVPTMFTGLSWGAHGVVEGRDRLSDGEETLAESLKASGYRTIGITATPNNSERLGMAQGFDEFVQLWEGADWRTSIDPMFAVERLQAILRKGLDESPLFLMLHLVPPHSPYTPPLEFRRWSDPEYDGPCDGTNEYLKTIRGNSQAVSPADLDELVALYDGNLKFSDAAVGRILEALAGAGRLERAVVVITSDHGEAFFEHGHLDHNTTVYDEMLQVPLIVRLPPSLQAQSIDSSRLISLEDLTPTLLGLAGLPSLSRSTGVDFVTGPRRNEILHRTSVGPGVFGFRTDRWKLIANREGRLFELYDLTADPDEGANVILQHPALVSWLADRWDRAQAALPPTMDVVDVGTTESEKAMLRELGYIDS